MPKRVLAAFAALALAGCGADNSVTVQNRSGRSLDNLRLAVGSHAFRLGPLEDGASRSVSFDAGRDAALTLCVGRASGDACADYGYVTPGLRQTHVFDILPDRVGYTVR